MKILLLTNEYPNEKYPKPDSPWVVPYFARAWVRQGHEVVVIVNSTKFPSVFYFLGRSVLSSYFTRKYSVNVKKIASGTWNKVFKFDDYGVQVLNLPLLKFVPSGAFPNCELKKQIKRIVEELNKRSFYPDVITGHWLNPQLQLISFLKDVYKCRTAFVFHSDYDTERLQKFKTFSYINNIDKLGCRSLPAARILQGNLNLSYLPFICSSGVPDEYVEQALKNGEHKFSNEILRVLTVGRLVPVKKYDKLIEAAHMLGDIPYTVKIIGEGPMAVSLQSQINSLSISNNVKLIGKKSRDEVQKAMRDADILVLIGMEVFGLVYIEAMMQGCIVIGTEGGGIDGIIIDGKNGFLCNHGDAIQLSNILARIKEMSMEEKRIISNNAINTAKQFSDTLVAERYLNDIIQ